MFSETKWEVKRLNIKKNYYITGSEALKPKENDRANNPRKERKLSPKTHDSVNLKMIKLKQKRSDRKYIAAIVVMIIFMGLTTLSRENKIYNMQCSVNNLGNEIKQVQENNEALNIKILKASSIGNIEKKSKNELKMYIPNKKEIVNVDFSNNYFKDLK